MKTGIEFRGDDGITLRGWLQVPDGAERPPVVLMNQGFGGHKEWGLPRLADILAEAGIAAIAYDHRNFGDSDGEPRFEADPQLQIRDYRAAITFAGTLVEVDPQRLGIFGTSLSGGHVLVLGAIDRRVRCVVSQVPTVSGWQQAIRRFNPDALAQMRERWDVDRRNRFLGQAPEVVQYASLDPSDSLSGRSMSRVAFFRGLTEEERRPWQNKITLRSSELQSEYEPGVYVSRISPTPLLMIVAEDDRTIGSDLSLELYARALEPKGLVLTKGGHYDVYGSEFDTAANATRDWFSKWLLASGERSADAVIRHI